jgi:hypothetical protein
VIGAGSMSEDVKITITTLLGQVVYTSEYSGKQMIVDMSAQAKGVYLVKIETADGMNIKKIIKE